MPPMRVAVVDIGSNSTRLLIADADAKRARIEEVVRRSQVTRLGEGLEASGALSERAIGRVISTLADYRREMDEHGCERNLAVLTAAVREAANGAAFADRVREQFALDAHVLSGEEEAQLTFLGAMSDGTLGPGAGGGDPAVVIDIGGGSTEFVIGRGREARFHISLPVGVVRMSERHIRHDPPAREELDSLARDARATFSEHLPASERAVVRRAIAVAGTATSAAAMDQELEPYDPARVHGYSLSLAHVETLLERTAAMTEAERRRIPGLHPDRAPTIIAGLVILRQAVRTFELDELTVSEHDILFGGAMRLAGLG
jgi:exopolyphosphatase/guanosine-5'-triphosphate,3'-diphosphate pyrophosphatase